MLFLTIFISANLIAARDLFICDESFCPSSWVGDGWCDSVCMNNGCNYDSQDTFSSTSSERFLYSDCFYDCMDFNCDYYSLGDGTCDSECNNYECGWDLGDCGYCSDGCTIALLENNSCDSQCNNYLCMYDNNGCGWCAEGCFYDDYYDTECQSACNVYNCNYDNYYCLGVCSSYCPSEWIGDSYCDYYCNNADCNYDGGDCDCDTGCNIDIYYESDCRYTNGVIDDPCATANCYFKHYACGWCNAGCFSDNLGDGICNQACNVEDCYYDFGDCGCNVGCSTLYSNGQFAYDGGCKKECLIPECGYNIGVCSDEIAIQSAILNQIIKKSWSKQYDSTQCSGDCIDATSQTYTELNQCSKSDACNSDKCLHCYGNVANTLLNCVKSDGSNCLICDTMMVLDQCVSIVGDCPLGYEEIDITGYFLPLEKWCFVKNEKNSINNYKIFYVSPSESADPGDGSKELPMVSLYYALISVYASYTKIKLDYTKDHYLQVYPKDATSLFITDTKNPLKTSSWYNYEELWIESDDENYRAVVYWTSGMKITPSAKKFYIRNIDFYGTKVLDDTCEHEFCLYCPYTQGSGSVWVDDRNENIKLEDYDKYGKTCNDYSSTILFEFTNSAILENVLFNGFRYQFSSLILVTGSLQLKNVDFQGMQAKASGSIIKITCTSDCINSDFYYETGVVQDLGAGYEDIEFVTTGSFFYGSGYHSATFTDVQFLYNFAFSNLQASTTGSLIYSYNQLGTITISSCNFQYNYVNNLIYIDVSSLVYSDYDIEQGVSVAYNQTHFQLKSTTFSHNYCSNYFIYYYMTKITHNIQIENVQIFDAVVGNNGIVVINNGGALKTSDKVGQIAKVVVGETIEKIEIPSRSVIITSLYITSSKCGGIALQVTTMPNVYINDLIISNIRDGENKDIKAIIDAFHVSNRYLSLQPPDIEIPSLNCTRITSLTDIYYLYMTKIEIFDTGCTTNWGTAGLYIDTISTNLTLDSLYIHDINDISTEPIGCFVKEIDNTYISNLYFDNVTNQDYAVLEFYQVLSVKLDNFTGDSLEAMYSGVNLFTLIEELTVTNVSIYKSISQYGNGGCFGVQASSQGLNITMTDITLSSCHVETGEGAGIYLNSISTGSEVLLKILDIFVLGCYSIDGAAIYISSKVVFNQDVDSGITNLYAADNYAYQGGIISDYHNDGVLVLDNMHFLNNEGLHSGIYCFYSLDVELLNIKNSVFENSTSYEGVFSLRSFVEGSSVIFENITMYNIAAVAFEATKIDITVLNSFFINMYSAVGADNYANVYFENCTIDYIINTVIVVSKNSYFECNNCLIQYCENTIMTVSDSSSINVTSSEISKNSAYSSVLLYATGKATDKKNTLLNSVFMENSAETDGIIYLSNTEAEITGCIFKDNNCTYTDYNGIYSSTSTLYIQNSEFYSQTARYSGGFMYLLSSESIIVSSLFSGGISYENGGAIYANGGTLSILNCEFWLNQAYNYGASLYLDSCDTDITSTLFYENQATTGDAIYATGTKLNILKSEFFNSMTYSSTSAASVALMSKCDLSIYDSQFKDSWGTVGGLYAENTGNAIIENCEFFNLNTIEYGAATFIGGSAEYSVYVKNSTFSYNNSTGNGTAMHIKNVRFEMIDTEISHNNAQISGGGLYLVSPNCATCKFYIKGSSKLVYNSCLKEGGAIKWLDSKPLINETVLIENNTAEYGANLASKATSLNYNKRMLSSTVIGYLTEIPPGQSYGDSINLYLFDPDGNIVKTDSSSQVTLTCADKDVTYFMSGSTTFTAYQGEFSITGFVPNGPPGSSMSILITTSGIEVSSSEPDVSNSVMINVTLRDCINGEAKGTSSCTPCTYGKYLIEPAESCKACPTGGVCSGKDIIISSSGYWRSNLLSEIVYACQISSACTGGDDNYLLGNCSTGYSDILCQSCEVGFSRDTGGKCSKCPDKSTNAVILLAFLVLIVFIAVILVKTTLKSAFAAKALHSIYIKIFTNYLQLVFLTAQFNLDWPTYVLQLFKVQKSAATVSEQLFSVDCYMDDGKSTTSSNSYFYKLGVLCCLPFVIALVSLAVWLTISFINGTYSYLRREFFTTIVVLFFLVYPNIVKAMFLNFSCVSVDMEGSFLDQNTAIKCWTSNHTKYSLIIALPGIIVWAIGTPALVLLRLTKQRRFLHRDDNKIIFGFIYNGYKISHYYWEFIIMYRKIIMITVSVFMSNQPTLIQALTVVIVLLFSLYLQYSRNPYCFTELNHMESEALFTATLTIYCGLYYLSNAITEELKLFLFFIIITGNSYFIIYWIYYMIQAIIELSLKIFPQIRHFLKKGDAFDDNFYSEDLVHEGTFINKMEGEKNYTFIMQNPKNNYMDVPSSFKSLMHTVILNELGLESDVIKGSASNFSEDSLKSEIEHKENINYLSANYRKFNSNENRSSVSSVRTELKEEQKFLDE
ncbi:hypothetical protein SteCoe_22156 [Stentor coeruleus]|uniref:LNR domain-containing protein n=1 Tax=Stentor coeruleus TaxID=5963 RepID=A0A1R2BMV0_9CILI|nr:hypothetical protein SteCoe_22156 [Stentor coeruleus]